MNKHLQYNFYNNHVKKINNSKYLFEGKPSDPNVILSDDGKNILFRSQYIFIDNKPDSHAYIVIDNSPITNHNKNLQLRFPVITDQSIENNGLDYVFSDKSNELELNSLLPDDENVEYIEDDTKITIIFQRPIKIKTVLKNDKGEHKSIIREGLSANDKITIVCDETYDDGKYKKPFVMVPVDDKYNNHYTAFMLGFHFILFLFYILASFLYIDELYSVLDSFGINESYVLYIIVAIFAVGFILISISITDVTEKQVTSGITGIYFIIFSSVWLIIKYVFKPQLEPSDEESTDEESTVEESSDE